jgi:hypothetical protein
LASREPPVLRVLEDRFTKLAAREFNQRLLIAFSLKDVALLRALGLPAVTATGCSRPRKRRYVAIFGEHDFEQRVYAPREGRKIEERPVDRQLGLPAGEHSYVLQDWQQRLCLKESSEESAASLESMLNVSLPVGTAERLNQRLAEQAEPFRLRQPPPDPEQEAELLVYADDCKGVPMRRPVEERAKGHRRGKGEKANKKKMACVGSGYSVDCFVRSADDILDEIFRILDEIFRAESGEGRLFAP